MYVPGIRGRVRLGYVYMPGIQLIYGRILDDRGLHEVAALEATHLRPLTDCFSFISFHVSRSATSFHDEDALPNHFMSSATPIPRICCRAAQRM